MSASVPANTASSTLGTVVAACTAATSIGDPVVAAITQDAAMSCIQVPMFRIRMARQNAHQVGTPKGARVSDGVTPCGALIVASVTTWLAGQQTETQTNRHRH